MHLKTRAVSALATLAMTASLVAVPALLQTSAAVPAPSDSSRAGVTAECAAAQAGLANAKAKKVKAKKSLRKARKSLRKAKKTHRPVKIRKAKKVRARAKHRFVNRSRAVRTQNKRVAYACSAPTSSTRASATGQKLDLLVLATGTVGETVDLVQLNALLDRLLPGVGSQLTPGQLSALLTGFNAGPLSLDDATALLDGTFSPTELQSLLAGTASPELVLALADHVIGQLSLASGLPVPGSFDPTDLLETIAGVFGGLDAAQLGTLLGLLTSSVGADPSAFDLAELTGLLDGLLPGVSDLLDPAQLTAMLGALNGGGLDVSTLSNLLGGQFSAAELQQVLNGTADDALVGEVIAHVVAQLGTVGGGGLELPGTIDPATLLSLVSTVTDLVDDVLGGVLGGDAGVCTLLPILC